MTVATDELLLSSVRVEIEASARAPTVSIVAYTGGQMVVPGWGPLVIDLAGVDVSASQISILADHDSTLRGVVGFGTAQVANGKLLVAGSIAPTTVAAKQIIELARSGFQFQASVGIAPSKWDRIQAGESVEVNGRILRANGNGFTLVRSSALKEVSIVAIGADSQTSVAIAASQKTQEVYMTTAQKTVEELRAEAADESERIHAIRQACNGQFGDIEAQAIREGWDEQKTKLAVVRASRPKAPAIHATSVAATPIVMQAAVLTHMGHETLAEKHLGEQAAQQARDMRVTSLVDLCRAALQIDGREAPSGRDALIRAALSTFSLPTALGEAANKVLFNAYTESPATWRAFAAIKSANDFKDQTGVRPSQTGDLEEVAHGGELKHGSLKEATYKYSVDTFGKMLTIDRRDIINDDLGLFEDTAASLGRAAMRSLSDLVYKVLLANADAFFDIANNNYDEGADTAISSVSLAAGVARIMAQRDAEGRDLDIRARTLLLPPELQQTAKELLLSDFIQRANDDTPTGNALKNIVNLEVEPRLSNTQRFANASAKAWYLFASSQDMPLVVAFLQGKQSPTVEFFGLDSDPNKLAATWRVYFDYGCALGDYRAAYRAKGAA